VKFFKKQIKNWLTHKMTTVNESGYSALKNLVMGLDMVWDFCAEEESRLKQELSFIQQTETVEFFWFVYQTWRAAALNGGGRVQGGILEFYSVCILTNNELPFYKPFTGVSLQDGFACVEFVCAVGKKDWMRTYIQKTYGRDLPVKIIEDNANLIKWAGVV
jgi:hypothetical protein